MKAKDFNRIIKAYGEIFHVISSFIVPFVLLSYFSYWLRNRFGWEDYIAVAGIFISLAVSCLSFYKAAKDYLKRFNSSERKKSFEQNPEMNKDDLE